MIDSDNLEAELKAALTGCSGFSYRSTTPGVPSGTLVELKYWVQRASGEWIGVDFTSAPSSQDQSTAATVVANHSIGAVRGMFLKMRAGGLEPPPLWAQFVKGDTATFNALTAGQRAALNGIIAAALTKASNVIQA